jgi:dienelactone hydrolase
MKVLTTDSHTQTNFAPAFDLEGTFKTPSAHGLAAVEYKRFRVSFNGRNGTRIRGYLLRVQTDIRPLPCLICLPGHGPGIKGDIGIEPDGRMRTTYGGRFNDFALQAVAHGHHVLAFDPYGLDEPSRHWGWLTVSQKLGCAARSISALLTGHSLLGYRVAEVLSAVDFACSLPDVDDSRIGVAGVSGGGTTALFSAAVDNRIKHAVLVSCVSTWKQSIFSQLHCWCNYVPAVTSRWDVPDLCAMIAPRPLFVEYGAFDDHFPPAGFVPCYKAVKGVYTQMHAESALGHELRMTGHCGFSGKKAFPFLSAHLSNHRHPTFK